MRGAVEVVHPGLVDGADGGTDGGGVFGRAGGPAPAGGCPDGYDGAPACGPAARSGGAGRWLVCTGDLRADLAAPRRLPRTGDNRAASARLLALLTVDLRAGCSTGRLVEGLWPDAQPDRPGKAVQVLVSRARSQLDAELIANTPTGYRLALEETQADSSALLHEAAGAERARKGDHRGALEEAEAGLAFWDASFAGPDMSLQVVHSCGSNSTENR